MTDEIERGGQRAARCSVDLGHEGMPSPRTCQVCGLGPCVRYVTNQRPPPMPTFVKEPPGAAWKNRWRKGSTHG